MAPRVSICIPAYNHGRFLRAAIESALSQSYADIEVLVSDNCSTDETREVVAALAAKDARVRYERSAEHTGMAQNFNRCLERAHGEYVKFLCADDLLERECVERLLAAMERDKAVLAGCARSLFRDSPDAVVRVASYANQDWSGPGQEAARRCFFFGNRIGEPTAVMFRRADVPSGFRNDYSLLVDLDLWIRLLERGRFSFLAAPLCRVRLHSAQATAGALASGDILRDRGRLFRDYAGRMGGSFAEHLLWDFRAAWSLQRVPPGHRNIEMRHALYYPRLWGAMVAAAALARRVRSPA